MISPDFLLKDGLLARADLKVPAFPATRVDYDRVIPFKLGLLQRAWELFKLKRSRSMNEAFRKFCRDQSFWLRDFALFMAIKDRQGPIHWIDWPRELSHRKPPALTEARRELADAIQYQEFIQFIFARQLGALRNHARSRNVRLIGDLPIFVSGDSADVWANPHLFKLDRNLQPTVVAGVPPDLFSKTGQRWGNPLYDWAAMKQDGYRWWIERFLAAMNQADLVRIDHFRGFAACWEIPAACPTAERGCWVQAPGQDLFTTLQRELGALPFIAEDLGVITPDVEALRDYLHLPGMRILQFAFGGDSSNIYLPHNYTSNTIVYTGTHDNDTTESWYRSLARKDRDVVKSYINAQKSQNISTALIRLAWASVAKIAIVPLQDLLALGNESRMNIPGQEKNNWQWRATKRQVNARDFIHLAQLNSIYGRV